MYCRQTKCNSILMVSLHKETLLNISTFNIDLISNDIENKYSHSRVIKVDFKKLNNLFKNNKNLFIQNFFWR
jgi:hypothetical protein